MAGDLSHEHKGSNGHETRGINSRPRFSYEQRDRRLRCVEISVAAVSDRRRRLVDFPQPSLILTEKEMRGSRDG